MVLPQEALIEPTFFESHPLSLRFEKTHYTTAGLAVPDGEFLDYVIELAAVSGGKPNDEKPCEAFAMLAPDHGRSMTLVSDFDQGKFGVKHETGPDRTVITVKGVAPNQAFYDFKSLDHFKEQPGGKWVPMGYMLDGSIERIVDAAELLRQKGVDAEMPLAYFYPDEEYLDGRKVHTSEFQYEIWQRASTLGIELEDGKPFRMLRSLGSHYRLNEIMRALNDVMLAQAATTRVSEYLATLIKPEIDLLTEKTSTAVIAGMSNIGLAHNHNAGPIMGLGFRHLGNIDAAGCLPDLDSATSTDPRLGDSFSSVIGTIHHDVVEVLKLAETWASFQPGKPNIDPYIQSAGSVGIMAIAFHEASCNVARDDLLPVFSSKPKYRSVIEPITRMVTGFGFRQNGENVEVSYHDGPVGQLDPVKMKEAFRANQPIGNFMGHFPAELKRPLAEYFGVNSSAELDALVDTRWSGMGLLKFAAIV